MIRRPFFGLGKPRLAYTLIESAEQVLEIPLPNKITLLQKYTNAGAGDIILKKGENVKTGQRVRLLTGEKHCPVSSATGTISDISQDVGYLGQSFTAVSIETSKNDQWDTEFSEVSKTPNMVNALQFLSSLPGTYDFVPLLNEQAPVDTIIITGVDKDLLVTTNQLIIKTGTADLSAGVEYLKTITGAGRIIIVVPPGLESQAGKSGAEVKVIEPVYPNTFPGLIMKNILGKVVPQGKSYEEMGVGFISAEAVAALNTAFTDGKVPISKVLTVITKDYKSVNVRARIGTPIKDIFKALNLEISHGDRLVLGGPMSGQAVYSEDIPVLPDTDAVMIQDKEQIQAGSDNHCINCGECVRACPANIPVNMLVRLLENGLYEEAVKEYDLLACLECGLCSYVCTGRIPILHYIMLGKHEFALIESMEESNA